MLGIDLNATDFESRPCTKPCPVLVEPPPPPAGPDDPVPPPMLFEPGTILGGLPPILGMFARVGRAVEVFAAAGL